MQNQFQSIPFFGSNATAPYIKKQSRPVKPTSAVQHPTLKELLSGGNFCVEKGGYSIYIERDKSKGGQNPPYLVIAEEHDEEAYWNATEGWTDPCITENNTKGPSSIGYQPNETNPYLTAKEGSIYTTLVLQNLSEIKADQKKRKAVKKGK